MGSLEIRVIPFCNDTSVPPIVSGCMTEPWQPRGNTFIWFLNFVLAFVFPVIPWELFFFLPFSRGNYNVRT